MTLKQERKKERKQWDTCITEKTQRNEMNSKLCKKDTKQQQNPIMTNRKRGDKKKLIILSENGREKERKKERNQEGKKERKEERKQKWKDAAGSFLVS